MIPFYISPNGVGNGLSSASPAGINSVKSFLSVNYTDDITVEMAQGTYTLSNTIVYGITETSTHRRVVFNGNNSTVSGGVDISVSNGKSWESMGNGIYRTSMPANYRNTERFVYVNGVRSVIPSITKRAGFYSRFSVADLGEEYYLFSDLPQISDFSVVYQKNTLPWSIFPTYFTAYSYSSNQVKLYKSTYFTFLNYDIGSTDPDALNPPPPDESVVTYKGDETVTLYGAHEFIVNSGEAAFDTVNNYVYYKLRNGEDISTATVILPNICMLFILNQAQNVIFRNINFTYSKCGILDNLDYRNLNYNIPSTVEYKTYFFRDIDNSLRNIKTEFERNAYGTAYSVNDERGETTASILVRHSSNIYFISCNFNALGGVGLHLGIGTKNSLVYGCNISNTGHCALAVGSDLTVPEWGYSVLDENKTSYNIVIDNVLSNTGFATDSSVGVSFLYTDNCILYHNKIENTTYSGIMHWGWAQSEPIFGGGEVSNNLVHNPMTHYTLSDGAGIYFAGMKGGASTPIPVYNNYILRDVLIPTDNSGEYGHALYNDQMTSATYMHDNVISGIEMLWVNNDGAGDIYGTFYVTNITHSFVSNGNNIYMPNPDPATFPDAAKAIVANAGVRTDETGKGTLVVNGSTVSITTLLGLELAPAISDATLVGKLRPHGMNKHGTNAHH